MIYLLILRALLGPAIVGEYDTEEECGAAAARYMKMLYESRSDDKHAAKLACVGFPVQMQEPKEWREART